MLFKKIVSLLAAMVLTVTAAANIVIDSVDTSITDLVRMYDDFEVGYNVGDSFSQTPRYASKSKVDGYWSEVIERNNAGEDYARVRVGEIDGNKVIEFYSGEIPSDKSNATPRIAKDYTPSSSTEHKAFVGFSLKKGEHTGSMWVNTSTANVARANVLEISNTYIRENNAGTMYDNSNTGINTNEWNQYGLLIDFDNWTSTLYVNGTVIFENASIAQKPASVDASTLSVVFACAFNRNTPQHSTYLDNVTITEVKEEYAAEVVDSSTDYIVLKTSTMLKPANIEAVATEIISGETVTVSGFEFFDNDSSKIKLFFDNWFIPGADYTLDLSNTSDILGRTKTDSVSFKSQERTFLVHPLTLRKNGSVIDTLESGQLTASVYIENMMLEEKDTLLLNVLYDENGNVEDIAYIEQSIPAGGALTLMTPAVNVVDTLGRTLKLFLIDSMKELNSLIDSVQYGIGTPETPANANREVMPGIRKIDIVNLDTGIAQIYVTLEDETPGQKVCVLVSDGSDIEYYNEGISNEKGVYVVNFRPDEEKEYDVLVVSESERHIISFSYATPQTAANTLSAINSASDAGSLLAVLKNQGYGLAINLDYLNSLTEIKQSSIADIMLRFKQSAGGTFATPSVASKAYFRAEALKRIEFAEDKVLVANIVDENAPYLDFQTYDTYKNFVTEAGRDIVCIKMLSVKAITGIDMVNKFDEEVILAGVYKAERWADVKTIFTRHYDIIGLTENAVTSAESSVFKNILGNGYSNLSALKSAFESETVKKPARSSGGGGISRITADVSLPVATPQLEIAPPTSKEYMDLDSVPWAKESVLALSKLGVVQGKGEGKFDPDAPVTREEIVKMLVISFELLKDDAISEFDDVSEADWYYPFVASATELGVTRGIGNGKFGTGRSVTRQDMTAMIYAAAKLAGVGFENTNDTPFSDDDSIADYAKESISALYKAEVISGMEDGSFAPKEPCTRAQAAKVIYGALRLKP